MAQAPKQGGAQQGQKRDSAFTFEQFAGVNTATVRSGVPDEQASWLDGFMPLAYRQLRTLWGVGPSLYTRHSSNIIVLIAFYNIGATPYAVVFESDGSAYQCDVDTGAVTTILPPGTITNPLPTNIGVSQYAQQYLLIVANQANGYWAWDGSVLYGAGTLAPTVVLTNVGNGYTSPPAVNATGGQGFGATFAATVANGIVTNVKVTNAGQGYLAGDMPTLTFSGGTAAGSGGVLTANMVHVAGGSGAVLTLNWVLISSGTSQLWQLVSVTVNNGGTGYTSLAQAPFVGGGPIGWDGGSPTLAIHGSAGVISSVSIVSNPGNPNNYYLLNSGGLPTATVTDPGTFKVNTVTVNNGGTGYSPSATIAASGGGAPVLQQATLSPVIVGGVITSVTVNNGGIYGSITPPSLAVNDTTTNAAGTISLMPFGISGTAVQTYSGHVWVFNGNVFNFSAPGSISNFATSAGGGSDQSSDNFLRVGYTQAIQTNGFLFVLGDSSMNYISGVTTTGAPPTTSFTNQNSDPEVGTPYPYAVTTLGQDILAANATGIFVSSGGGFVKRSEALDGVYNSVPNFGGIQLSAAKATIFGKRVWMVLAPIIDPVSGTPPQATSAITAAGSPILTFSSVPSTILPGQFVYNVTNPKSIVPGPLDPSIGTTVLSTTSSTVTLTDNVALQVNSGDVIVFFTQKFLMFNGKQWWCSTQDAGIQFIAGQEINSTFTAWGTDGFSVFPLFQQPSANIAKVAQTKYWDDPGYEGTKTATRFWSLWQIYSTIGTSFTLDVDAVGLDANNNQFVSSSTVSMNAVGATGTVVPTIPEAVGQQGVLLGFTISTNAPDMALVSAKMLPDLYQYRG